MLPPCIPEPGSELLLAGGRKSRHARACPRRLRFASPAPRSASAWMALLVSFPAWEICSVDWLRASSFSQPGFAASHTSACEHGGEYRTIEVLVGTIPLLGDAFDIAWKANRRNYALMTRHLQQPRRHTWRDWVFLGCIATALLAIFIIPVILIVWIAVWLHARMCESRKRSCLHRSAIQFKSRGVAQSGSASALGAEGRGFESLRPDHSKGVKSKTPVSWRPAVGEFVGSRLVLLAGPAVLQLLSSIRFLAWLYRSKTLRDNWPAKASKV